LILSKWPYDGFTYHAPVIKAAAAAAVEEATICGPPLPLH
jgi:hypothetical protein